MIILASLLIAVLLVSDIVLIMYCKVRRPFTMFTFSFLIVILAFVSLLLTGDISIAFGG